ncbi:nucleotide exchange factor GrpE [Halanaeroarchaeum sulfurireducens]|uniref:Protein GrpE n=1 Tax=Halanaeroarchaeum sulfurireducens TaxID=1604004 RepID=A0A0F7P7Y2_9EURY|nr:nucleotide exchange factor GrpE [Halanaeroarchaeum sulfurireducens]AKH97251.1 molecular chaperone GrpE [Halanaeroarchaeum sulfurireducens]ALG81653.1 molecular chaperone GrpE [Halanaeroarchaeum sulfurireducens]
MTAADEHADTEQTLDLVAEVGTHDEVLGAAVAALEARIEDLEETVAEKDEEIDELTERLQRTQADFQNYKKRTKERQSELVNSAKGDLIERFLAVRDDLSRALEDGSDDLKSLEEGVRVTRNEFDRVLDAEDVRKVDPEPGSDVDPTRHEVMMRVDSDEPADTVADVFRPGYEMEDAVLRTAQVTVSDGPAEEDGESDQGGGDQEADAETDGDEPE